MKNQNPLEKHLPAEALEAMAGALAQGRPTVTVFLTPQIVRRLAMGKVEFIDGGKGPFLLFVPEKLVKQVYAEGHPKETL